MSNILGKSETKSLDKSTTKTLSAEEKKKLGVSETRGKKMKHSYNVNDPENALVMKLKDGEVVIEMYPDAAPNHVARIKELEVLWRKQVVRSEREPAEAEKN